MPSETTDSVTTGPQQQQPRDDEDNVPPPLPAEEEGELQLEDLIADQEQQQETVLLRTPPRKPGENMHASLDLAALKSANDLAPPPAPLGRSFSTKLSLSPRFAAMFRQKKKATSVPSSIGASVAASGTNGLSPAREEEKSPLPPPSDNQKESVGSNSDSNNTTPPPLISIARQGLGNLMGKIGNALFVEEEEEDEDEDEDTKKGTTKDDDAKNKGGNRRSFGGIRFRPPSTSNISSSRRRFVRGGVKLYGCTTVDEHYDKHDSILQRTQALTGAEGLKVADLEFRQDKVDREKSDHNGYDEEYITRLYSMITNEPIGSETRRQHITDGPFYDEMARLAQEVATERLIEEGDLEWRIFPEDDEASTDKVNGSSSRNLSSLTGEDNNGEAATSSSRRATPYSPVQALVSKQLHPNRPTLIVSTGKGKVRAGMFSRQHLLMTSMEQSCALFTVREARKQQLNLVLLDPNGRGHDRHAMSIITSTLRYLIEEKNEDDVEKNEVDNSRGVLSKSPLLIQAHSAAGAYLVRYLMDHVTDILPRVQALIFTDSTHSIQWCRRHDHLHPLAELLESTDKSMYFRSSHKLRDEDWEQHIAGAACSAITEHWVHRFGVIPTFWAGTAEHSLSDWYAREYIWKHFERRLSEYYNDNDEQT